MPSPANGKPQIAESDVLALLRERFAAPIEGLAVVSGGQIAQTYGFSAGGERYILRFTQHMGANLDKEVFIQRLLAASPVPVAPILQVGRLGDLHYAISRRMPGAPLTALPPDAFEEVYPTLRQTLDDIHAVDVSAMSGFGIFGDDGVGFFPSWRASLASIREEEPEWDFYGKWHALFESTFLERDLWDGIYARMTELLAVCPEERYLVHGNYGFGNVLAADARITAVLDWLDAKYGDILFDVAWLDFWSAELNVRGRFATHYAERGIPMPHYPERILCYQCYIALDGLRFFAKRRHEASYRWVRDVILSRL
jgi:hygromycin-B 4-O-kinase